MSLTDRCLILLSNISHIYLGTNCYIHGKQDKHKKNIEAKSAKASPFLFIIDILSSSSSIRVKTKFSNGRSDKNYRCQNITQHQKIQNDRNES